MAAQAQPTIVKVNTSPARLSVRKLLKVAREASQVLAELANDLDEHERRCAELGIKVIREDDA